MEQFIDESVDEIVALKKDIEEKNKEYDMKVKIVRETLEELVEIQDSITKKNSDLDKLKKYIQINPKIGHMTTRILNMRRTHRSKIIETLESKKINKSQIRFKINTVDECSVNPPFPAPSAIYQSDLTLSDVLADNIPDDDSIHWIYMIMSNIDDILDMISEYVVDGLEYSNRYQYVYEDAEQAWESLGRFIDICVYPATD